MRRPGTVTLILRTGSREWFPEQAGIGFDLYRLSEIIRFMETGERGYFQVNLVGIIYEKLIV
jgi:hypothetical protein